MENLIKQLKVLMADRLISVEAVRKGLEMIAAMAPRTKDLKRIKVDISGIKAEWLTIPGVAEKHAILYLHGGGYVAGSPKTSRDFATRIARASKARILIINYRLAPEHPFPAAVEDALTVYRWLVSTEGVKPNDIVITGDSAGGGLTTATLVKLRDEGDSLPAAAALISPWADLACTGESFKTNVEVDPLVTQEGLKFMAEKYLGGEDARNPLASPVYANLQGLPPLYISVGSTELLRDDAVRLADRAKAVGVNVTLDIWEDMPHVFQQTAQVTPEGKKGIQKIGEFIQKFLK